MNKTILKHSLLIILIVTAGILVAIPFLSKEEKKWDLYRFKEWFHLSFLDKDIASKLKVPSLKDQPTDTQITAVGPPIHHWQTKNGVSVYFIPTEGLPMLDIQLSLRAGSASDGAKPGVANLVASLLNEGTDKLTVDDIAEQFDSSGTYFDAEVERDRTVVALRSLTSKEILNQGVALFSRLVSAPSLHQDSLERVRLQMLADINQQSLQPSNVAYQAVLKALYGAHPYNHLALGTLEGLSTITASDLQTFHKKYYVAENAVITMVGGVLRDDARALSEQIALSLPKGEKNAEVADVHPLKDAVQIKLPFASAQSQVFLAQLGRVAGDADLYALTVGNHILGGLDNSRLFKELREDKGLVYGVRSTFERASRLAPFYISLQTAPNQAKEAEALIHQILTKFVTDGPSDHELVEAKKYLSGSFPLNLSSNGQTIGLLTDYAFYHLPKDFFSTYSKHIEGITREDVKKAFEKHIPLNTLMTVVVGGA